MSAKEDAIPSSGLIHARIAERLFESRTVLVHGEITSKRAQEVTAQLLALAAASDEPITMFLHSEGGHVEAGDSIHDIIRFIKPRVRIVGTGWVASAGVHIYLSVPREDRLALPNTRFMIHQPMGGAHGRASDIHIEAELLRARAAQPVHRRRDRAVAREGRGRHRPQLLDESRRGAGVRDRR
jgi:ATP-dependent Clp protease protease subunit